MSNRLIHESSPYLLQHAHNPVDWYPWGEEALQLAKAENKPILVSIGYSACHWCHVMERESFENEEIAAYMNQHFVNIKIDREERPDIDAIYMDAVQVLTGAGGWPLNCFLTPDARPFYGGTYFPPVSKYQRPSWIEVLRSLSDAFRNKRDTIEDQANRLMEHLEKSDTTFTQKQTTNQKSPKGFDLMRDIFYQMRTRFDGLEGGFGGAPKFPGTMVLGFLLKYYHNTKNTPGSNAHEALAHVELTLNKMIRGGIYDQIGGGFARYTTDRAWLIPHFEKMLYDNALLVHLLADAYKLTQKPLYKTTIEETLTYIQREMMSEEGGFYAAQDADSEGVEGKFFVWDKSEIEAVLGDEADLFCQFYDVTEKGNWEEKNILNRPISLKTFTERNGLNSVQIETKFNTLREKLFEYREKRIKPGLDDKILLSWNALMCTGFAKAYEATKNEKYRQIVEDNLAFIFKKFQQAEGSQTLLHTYKNGIAKYEAFLDDYAFLIAALLDAYEITFDTKYIDKAGQLTDFVIEKFFDKTHQLFYYTSENQTDVIVRQRQIYDNATPSGNSTMVSNLKRLSLIKGREDYAETANKMLDKMQHATIKYPTSFGRWAEALTAQIYPYAEIAIVGKNAENMAAQINTLYLPHKIIMAVREENEAYPLLLGKYAKADETLTYICRNYACQAPVETIEGIIRTLNKS